MLTPLSSCELEYQETKEEDHLQRIGRKSNRAMISLLAQERLLGFAAGSLLTGIVVFQQRRSIYDSITGPKSESVAQSQMREPMFGGKTRSEVAHLWNKAVDDTFRPVIKSLSSSGW